MLACRWSSGNTIRLSWAAHAPALNEGRQPPRQLEWHIGNAAERTVTFANPDGTPVVVADGTAVIMGGGGDSSEESGIGPEAWLDGMTWVARPADGCPIDSWWGVAK
jgi:hypothetical protein